MLAYAAHALMYRALDRSISLSMNPAISAQFIESALFYSTGPFALSYSDHKQKWLIKKHLVSLIQDYPMFTPSTDTFNHNDGTTVALLNVTGDLHVCSYTPHVPITIWIHENYPYVPPMVFVLSNSSHPIRRDHPFVDPSGATTCTYLQTWEFPGCNITQFVRNLINLFSLDHPLDVYSSAPTLTRPSLVSKMEALDRLSGTLQYDLMIFLGKTEAENEDFCRLQVELSERDKISTNIVDELEKERTGLEDSVTELKNQADVLINWLRANDAKLISSRMTGNEAVEDAFVGADEESNLVIDYMAADWSIEDTMYALDKAFEHEVMSFDRYLRQVRILAREQFLYRAMLLKLRGPI